MRVIVISVKNELVYDRSVALYVDVFEQSTGSVVRFLKEASLSDKSFIAY